jgi:GGDEF domain-containing protein
LGEPYLKLLDHAQTHGGSVLDRELDVLGFDHAVLGARLLTRWGLPAALCAAVAVPPDEAQISGLSKQERLLPQMLHLAELLACLIEQPHGSALYQLLQIGGRYCQLKFEDLQPIVAVLQNKVQELAKVLSLELPAGEHYIDLLVAAHERLAAAAFEMPEVIQGREEDVLRLAQELKAEMASVHAGRAAASPRPVRPSAAADHHGSTIADGGTRNGRNGGAAALTGQAAQQAVITEPGLAGRVTSAINRCRQARCAVSLALVELDGFSDLMAEAGPSAAAELLHWLGGALSSWSGQRIAATLVGETTFALLWENCTRSDAVRSVRQTLDLIRSCKPPVQGCEQSKLTLSAGLATLGLPPKNFPAQELITAAQRCLSGAMLSGGDTLKSIEF